MLATLDNHHIEYIDTMIKIDIDDTQVLAALNRLIEAGTDRKRPAAPPLLSLRG
jgi:hypothetical protein